MGDTIIGKVTHYFGRIQVAIVELEAELKVGDKIKIGKDEENSIEQSVSSIQIEHQNVESAKKGDAVGLKVENKVREGDTVSKIE